MALGKPVSPVVDDNWFEELFINEAKPALERHTGGGSADFDDFMEGNKFNVVGGATSIRNRVFMNCETLMMVDLPQATTIGEESFYGCTSLTKVNIPQAATIGDSAFNQCKSLSNITLPQAISIGSSAFYICTSLTKVNIPQATTIDIYAFYKCEALTTVDLPQVISIGEYGFYKSIVETLVLRSETLCDMNISAVIDTKIVDATGTPTGEGFIYIPTALYESYVADLTPKIVEFATANGVPMDEPTATYVATAILRKLEDYTVDGTVTGALDETKI